MSTKKREDLSQLTEESIPKYLEIAQESVDSALEQFLLLEKRTRQAEDSFSTGRVLVAIVEMLFEKQAYKTLLEYIVLLSKRRAQLKEAVKQMVKKCMTFIDLLDYDTKMELIRTLVEVTEGKIYVEKQRARLTLLLAGIYEAEGNVQKAAEIIQEVQVETFGAMKRREKTEFILEQMRLCLAKRDFIRTRIISRKINPVVFANETYHDLKIRYYSILVEYYHNENEFLEIAKAYFEMYNTPSVKEDDALMKNYLTLIAVYISLAPYNNETSDMMNRIALDKNLEKVAPYKFLVDLLLTEEIINWSDLETNYTALFGELEPFKNQERANTLWSELRLRVIEHNIRIVAKYYKSITTARLAELLNLDAEKTEEALCKEVVAKKIYAKIDRIDGVVSFRSAKGSSEILNEWSNDIKSLLGVVEKTTHYIQRENMIHHINQN
eukprot:TRINITY_DN10910_c0_g1_i1.p1 TRINITY_DN10910_c0_g1~~TRINITY_DN10910_c0_g1_i1.p1  ORF type:complete len:439 (+),score=116.73 TRINITY_DN10910_c0_g1_i1:31-1347(+)